MNVIKFSENIFKHYVKYKTKWIKSWKMSKNALKIKKRNVHIFPTCSYTGVYIYVQHVLTYIEWSLFYLAEISINFILIFKKIP